MVLILTLKRLFKAVMKSFHVQGLMLLMILYASCLYSQEKDTLKSKTLPKDTVKVNFNQNKINKLDLLSNLSDTNGTDEFIWNDKRNLQEILNEKSGFYAYYFGTGGKSFLNFNGLSNVGVFRNGIEANNQFYGGFDVESFSVNEIDKIEEVSTPLSFIYGLNPYGKIVNVIDKDNFQPNLFTQFRYSQDRDGALFADVYMNLPISRKFNFLFGINNYASDGHYQNSDFSFWRSRFQFNYFPSDRFNLKFFISANKQERGQNDGLIFNNSKDTLLDPNLVLTANPDAYEKIFTTYSDIKLTGRFFRDTLSLTNFNIFTNNSIREYRDEENRNSPNGIFIGKNFHSVQYGFNLNQTLYLIPFKLSQIKLLAGVKGYYNLYNYDRTAKLNVDSVIGTRYFDFNAIDIYSRLDLSYDKFLVSGGIKSQRFNNTYHFMYGAEAKYILEFTKTARLEIKGGTNNTTYGFDYESIFYDESFNRFESNYNASRKQYYEAGFKFVYNDFAISYLNYYSNVFSDYSILNSNISLGYDSKFIAVIINLNSFDENNYAVRTMPKIYLSSDLAYKGLLFKNKLKLKTGFNIKYISDRPSTGYNQMANHITLENNNSAFDFFDADFYVGARIGKANINITVANIFNNLLYTSALYPFDDRGGLLRSISRFTITWDFWN